MQAFHKVEALVVVLITIVVVASLQRQVHVVENRVKKQKKGEGVDCEKIKWIQRTIVLTI